MDLGQYAGEVLLAYGATGALIGAMVVLTLRRSRAIKRALEEAEARRG
ncbi:MAG: heme exporter protein CcmD [Pseudomonadota bacterium]